MEQNRKVTFMKKKILLALATCLCIGSLAACGTDATAEDYNGYTYDEICASVQQTVSVVASLEDSDFETIIENGDEVYAPFAESWVENVAEAGTIEDLGEFNLTKAGKTLTAEQYVDCSVRDMTVTFVFDYTDMELTAINVDLVYSTGEKMAKAGLNTIMCIAIVFFVLILISLVIYAFKLIPYFEKKFSKKNVEPTDTKKQVVEQIAARETRQDNNELVAVIAAAIAAATGTSTDDFVVRSIKRR